MRARRSRLVLRFQRLNYDGLEFVGRTGATCVSVPIQSHYRGKGGIKHEKRNKNQIGNNQTQHEEFFHFFVSH